MTDVRIVSAIVEVNEEAKVTHPSPRWDHLHGLLDAALHLLEDP